MSTLQLRPLFFSPLVSFQHPGPENFNAALWRDACSLRERERGPQGDQLNGSDWRSNKDIFRQPESSFSALRNWIRQCATEASQALSKDFDKQDYRFSIQAWININGPGSMNGPHRHPGCHWSGVYYVKIPAPDPQLSPSSGIIEFVDPRTCVFGNSLPKASCFSEKQRFTPESGMLLLFPPYLTHWVHPNESQEERMSIAFNIRYLTAEQI